MWLKKTAPKPAFPSKYRMCIMRHGYRTHSINFEDRHASINSIESGECVWEDTHSHTHLRDHNCYHGAPKQQFIVRFQFCHGNLSCLRTDRVAASFLCHVRLFILVYLKNSFKSIWRPIKHLLSFTHLPGEGARARVCVSMRPAYVWIFESSVQSRMVLFVFILDVWAGQLKYIVLLTSGQTLIKYIFGQFSLYAESKCDIQIKQQ